PATTTSATPVTTTTSTTTPRPTTTTTTIPDSDSCETESDRPTFRSLDCHLAALLEVTETASGLGNLQERPLVALGKAKQRVDLAEGWCAKHKTRQANARLKQVAQQLAQYAQTLRGLSARKRVAEEIREPLAEAADRIRA